LADAIYISDDLANSLISLIESTNISLPLSPSLFYNKKGPIQYDEDEIYIDCQPVNSSGKVEVSVNNSNSNNSNQIADASEITIIATLEAIGVFVFIFIILYLGSLLYRAYGPKTSSQNNNSQIYSIVDYLSTGPKNPSQNNAQFYSIVDYLSSIFKPST